MPYVLVSNGVVTEKTGSDPFIIFAPGYAAQFFYTDQSVEIGWLYDAETNIFSAPLVDPIDEEAEAVKRFELQRIGLLSETDWWAVRASEPGGTPMTEAQIAYRAALRTMDDAEDFDPFNPDWPEKP